MHHPNTLPKRANAPGVRDRPKANSDPLHQYSKHRAWNTPVAATLCGHEETRHLGKRIANCSHLLSLDVTISAIGDVESALRGAMVCNARLCPFCEWRRTRAWRARLYQGLTAFHQDHANYAGIFLTFTVRNPALTDLRQTIQEMNLAWNRMTRLSWWPSPFWFRRTEVTISDCPADGRKAHPHFHVLVMVPPSYFGKNYIKQLEWQKQWMMAARLDYVPVVDVRRAKANGNGSCQTEAGSSSLPQQAPSAVVEAAKYASKAADLLELGDAAPELHWQLRGLRLTAVSKGLRAYMSDDEITETDLLDHGPLIADKHADVYKAVAVWFEDRSEYQFADIS